MKICYKSFDGKEFNTEEECRRYEGKNAEIKMYSPDGLTQDPNLAFAVKIGRAEAAERFIRMCYEKNACCTGINHNLNGIYVWSEDYAQYFLLDSLPCKALRECFKDMEMQE